GVRFTQIYYGNGQPWDTHRNHNDTTRRLCQDIDRPVAALLDDLKRRGLLESTLRWWSGAASSAGPRPPRAATAAITTTGALRCGWQAAARRAAWLTGRPTSSASPPSRTGCTSTTCTPPSCT